MVRASRVWMWMGVLALSLPASAVATGDIWLGKDDKGQPFFTDTPPTYHGFRRFWTDPSRSGSVFKDFSGNFSRWDTYIKMSGAAWDVEPELVKAVIWAESAFNPKATSPSGAQGLMQLIPSTARLVGVEDAYDAEQNINGGSRYLGMNLRRFNGDRRLAVAAYNAGPGAVEKFGGIPPYSETRNYVDRVMTLYNHFLVSGLGALPSKN